MAGDKTSILTPTEVAGLLMVSPITVRQWAQKGMLPAQTTAGGHRRFMRSDVEQFARERGLTLPDMRTTVLVVDDDHQLNKYLVAVLQTQVGDVEVFSAYDGFEAGRMVAQHQPEIVLLDIMMPGMNGIEVCRRLRQDAYLRHIPILMLTARTEEEIQVEGLDVGADIYFSKPVSIPILSSQIRALLRTSHRGDTPPDVLVVHNLEIDRESYLVYLTTEGERETIRLPRKEFELLYYVATHPGKVFSRQELLDQVWGHDVYVVDRTVDVHVRKIREKLGNHLIETVKGIGYKFKA